MNQIVLDKLGPGQSSPQPRLSGAQLFLEAGQLGPGQSGPGAQLFVFWRQTVGLGAQLSGAQLYGAQFAQKTLT